MTVAIVGNQPFALARFRTLLIRDLVSQGHTVYALCPDWELDHVSRATIEQAGAVPVDIDMGRSAGGLGGEARSVRSIRRELARIRPDAVFSYFVKPVVYTAVAAVGLRIRRRVAMIEGLGFMGASEGARARAMRVLYRLAGSRYDALFVLNDADETYFRQQVRLRPSVVRRVEGMGIDLDEFAAVPPPSGPFMALFAARMLRQKGVWEFVEAAARVRKTHPDARFVMIGDVDDSLDSVSAGELAARTAVAGVEWKGHVDTVAEYLAEASVFVLPSFYREGYPRTIMEAMAAGRAVITTDNPGCREAVAEGDNGLIIPPRDAGALAAAMVALADDPARAAAMGRRGRELATERYDHRVINADVIDALTGVKPTLA
jgi:glycosyltransferase involved in cell wall biosynthesis